MRSATAVEHEDVAELLVRAFADEPFWRWITRGDPARRAAFARIALHGVAVPHGCVLVAPALTCAALLVDPGALPHPPLRSFGPLRGLARTTGARHLPGVLREVLRVERLHPAEPHLTLLVLGVDPEHHSLGLGSAALEAVAARADARGLPVYLETSTPRGRALYERHGYRLRDELVVRGGPPVWTLMRPVGG